MTKLEEKFEEFNELLISVIEKSSYKQKKYAKKLLEELAIEMLIQEKRIIKLMDMPENEYQDVLFKAISLLQIFGITHVDFELYHKDFIEWLVDKLTRIKKTLTIDKLNEIRKLYNLYVADFGHKPAMLKDLNKIITQYQLEGYETKTT